MHNGGFYMSTGLYIIIGIQVLLLLTQVFFIEKEKMRERNEKITENVVFQIITGIGAFVILYILIKYYLTPDMFRI
ncbi:hypothetical protein CN357_22190 [Bacillus cereus]|uniref:Uncharacterized protein n=2 Tax=Bacillus TaxID=1386 RepID=A0A9X6VVY3_BACCE|nr:hypothetical protein CN515_06260 [Bacillus cereus]PFA29410.1 hypothetical protein CN384_06825 [Bacillus thuringiensis]PGB15613.1 hypothetical protein COM09_08325 [Bacillus toyonensis]PFF46157.1 hypothetical protein CN357_22190 [Bacillus cereus]PFQ24123.1 hypothetical protein COK33_33815 [Bacillus cereus]